MFCRNETHQACVDLFPDDTFSRNEVESSRDAVRLRVYDLSPRKEENRVPRSIEEVAISFERNEIFRYSFFTLSLLSIFPSFFFLFFFF